jgi:hypothetical protein
VNIDKLHKGQTFKNYKELCVELEMEIQTSSSKNAQLKELARYCKFNKLGHKFIIEEVYSNPLPKIENRGKSEGSRNNNNVYGDLIQLLILDLLAQCKGGYLTISRGKLLLVINVINNNYSQCGEHIRQLSKYADIEEGIIYDFYNTSNSNFKSTVEIALKNLMNKRIIWFDTVTKIVELETNIHRIATNKEKETILLCEKQVLDELKFKQISDVRVSKHWRKFKRKVKRLLNEQSNISYYYLAYEIVVNKSYLQEERKSLYDLLLETEKRNQYKDKLNMTVQNNIIKNAENRRNKISSSHKFDIYRSGDNYINDIERLINLLINNQTCDIMDYVTNTKIDGFTDEELELLEDCDELFS